MRLISGIRLHGINRRTRKEDKVLQNLSPFLSLSLSIYIYQFLLSFLVFIFSVHGGSMAVEIELATAVYLGTYNT